MAPLRPVLPLVVALDDLLLTLPTIFGRRQVQEAHRVANRTGHVEIRPCQSALIIAADAVAHSDGATLQSEILVGHYASFRFCIVHFNLLTPGRAPAEMEASGGEERPAAKPDDRATGYLAALGGAANLTTIDACTTRLRLAIRNDGLVDEVALTRLGARGVIRPGLGLMQVVIGPSADLLAGELREISRRPPSPAGDVQGDHGINLHQEAARALGGSQNIKQSSQRAERVVVTVEDVNRLDRDLMTR